jgi:hypothetical protein
MRSDNAELSLTRTFRLGAGAAEWANRVLEIIGEKLRIIPAPHRTTVSIEEKSVTIDALLARTNAGTLDEAIHGLDRRRKIHVMGVALWPPSGPGAFATGCGARYAGINYRRQRQRICK